MELSAAHVRGIANHIGYGNPSAPLWFVGAEEGLGGKMNEHEQAANLTARATWAPIMDMAEAHAMLREGGNYIVDLINRTGATGPWRCMARIARAFEGKNDFADRDLAAQYVRQRLGRKGGDTFLTEISAFPAAVSQQPVELRNFADRQLIREVVEARQAEQMRLLRESSPKAIICYGTSLYKEFESHFGLKWYPLRTFQWRSKKSGSLRETTVYQSTLRGEAQNSSTAFLLPFFGNGALSPDVLQQFVATPEFQNCTG